MFKLIYFLIEGWLLCRTLLFSEKWQCNKFETLEMVQILKKILKNNKKAAGKHTHTHTHTHTHGFWRGEVAWVSTSILLFSGKSGSGSLVQSTSTSFGGCFCESSTGLHQGFSTGSEPAMGQYLDTPRCGAPLVCRGQNHLEMLMTASAAKNYPVQNNSRAGAEKPSWGPKDRQTRSLSWLGFLECSHLFFFFFSFCWV